MSRFLKEELRNVEPYVPGEQPKNQRLIKLNTNESPFPPAPGVLEKITQEEIGKLGLYPDPWAGELTQAASDFYGIPKSRIVAGNGSDELLAFLFMAYGKKVYYPSISYGFYKVYGEMFAKETVEVPLDKGLRISPEDYWSLDGTILLANPNAPTGMVLGRKEIKGILQHNPDNLVIIDEAYVDFGGESMVSAIEEYDNLLVIQTLSKSRSLAGARIGIAMGKEELIQDINRIRFSFNPYNMNRLSILAGAASFRDSAYFHQCCQQIIENRESFTEKLTGQGFRVLPSKANFVFASPPGMTGKAYFEKLRENAIIVRYFDHPQLADFVRISIGEWADMEEILRVNREMR